MQPQEVNPYGCMRAMEPVMGSGAGSHPVTGGP